MEARSLPSKKRFHAAHIHICKICHRTAPLNQLHRVLHVPSHRTQDSQSHHRRPVYSRRAMNEQLRVQSFERRFRKFHTLPKQPRWLRLEIIIRRIPQHLDAVSPTQRRIIELNLHIDDVRNPRLRHLRHILRRPNPASNRNPVGQPCDIHSYPVWPVPDAPALAFFLRIALLGRALSASRSLRRMGNFAPGPTLIATRSSCCTASPPSTVSFTPDRVSATMLSGVSSSGSESSCSSILALPLGLIPFFLGRLDDCRVSRFSPVGLLHRLRPVHPGRL